MRVDAGDDEVYAVRRGDKVKALFCALDYGNERECQDDGGDDPRSNDEPAFCGCCICARRVQHHGQCSRAGCGRSCVFSCVVVFVFDTNDVRPGEYPKGEDERAHGEIEDGLHAHHLREDQGRVEDGRAVPHGNTPRTTTTTRNSQGTK